MSFLRTAFPGLLTCVLAVCPTGAFWASGQDPKGASTAVDKQLEGVVRAPEFPAGLEWLNTPRPLTMADLKGKLVLLDFWTYCCINCMHIIPDLKRLEEKYADSLVVIGVHSAKFTNEKGTANIRQAVLRYGVRHPVVNDKNLEVWSAYSVRAWPTLVLINPGGRIIGQYAGEGVFEPFDDVLARAVPYFDARGDLKKGPLTLAPEADKAAPTLLSFPGKVSADERGQRLFITDSGHHRILITDGDGRFLDVIGSGREGRADGPFEEAEFHHPQGTALVGDVLYVADTENHLVRAADLKSRRVTTVFGTGNQAASPGRGGAGTQVDLSSPWDLAAAGDTLYIAMAGTHQVWAADLKSRRIAPYAGSGREARIDGPLAECALAQPSGITADGEALYTADSESSSIRKVEVGGQGKVETLVGEDLFVFGDVDGSRGSARLQHPLGVAFHGGMLYVADTYNSKIKRVDPLKRTAATLAGTGAHGDADGPFAQATFSEPGGLCFLGERLYVADTNNHAVRVLDLSAGTVRTLAFSGLDKLASRTMDDFKGRVVRLPGTNLKPGAATVVLSLALPAGAHLNAEAPGALAFRTSDPAAVAFAGPASPLDLTPATFPLKLAVRASAGRADLTLDAVVYYCREKSGVCYFDQVRLEVPVTVGASGSETLPLALEVKPPG